MCQGIKTCLKSSYQESSQSQKSGPIKSLRFVRVPLTVMEGGRAEDGEPD